MLVLFARRRKGRLALKVVTDPDVTNKSSNGANDDTTADVQEHHKGSMKQSFIQHFYNASFDVQNTNTPSYQEGVSTQPSSSDSTDQAVGMSKYGQPAELADGEVLITGATTAT
jgi:hypothetical protein